MSILSFKVVLYLLSDTLAVLLAMIFLCCLYTLARIHQLRFFFLLFIPSSELYEKRWCATSRNMYQRVLKIFSFMVPNGKSNPVSVGEYDVNAHRNFINNKKKRNFLVLLHIVVCIFKTRNGKPDNELIVLI